MNKWLIAGISTPLLLSGCGGSDGGGNSLPVKSYTWQFVQMKSQPQATMNQFCEHGNATVFSLDDSDANSANWLYTYAAVAPTVSDLIVYNADGSEYTEGSLDKYDIHQTNGTLAFTENDIPDGGYVAIVDESNVLLVTKDALSDSLIKINQNQGKQSCYTSGSLVKDSNKKKVNIATFSGVNTTAIETYFDGQSLKDNGTIKDNLTVLSQSETVLITAYTSAGDVNGFKYVDKSGLSNSSVATPNTVILDTIFDEISITFNEPAGSTFSSFGVSSVYKGFTFDWFNWSAHNSAYKVAAPLDTQYQYAAEYNGSLNGWSVKHNSVIEDSTPIIDLNLDTPMMTPVFDCSGAYCAFSTSDVTSDKVAMSKIKFREGNARYTVLSKSSEFVVPKITNIEEPTSATDLDVSMLLMDDSSSEIEESFKVLGHTRDYVPSSDYVDFIAEPLDDLKQQVTLKSNTYSIISK